MAGTRIECLVLLDPPDGVRWGFPKAPADDAGSFPRRRDLLQFCFPEGGAYRAAEAREHIFALTDGSGGRLFGFCLGGLQLRPAGARTGPSVHGRGSGSCLCLLSRRPSHTAFMMLLRHLHGVLLLYPEAAAHLAKEAVAAVNATAPASPESSLGSLSAPGIAGLSGQELLKGRRDLLLGFPRGSEDALRQVAIMPLLNKLGAHKFMLVLSALLCERRVVFVSDTFSALSGWVLAAVAALHPFTWHGVLVPLLPKALLSFVAAPMPFVVGVHRAVLTDIASMPLSDIVWVDLDKPCVRVGNSPSVLNAAASRNSEDAVAQPSGMYGLDDPAQPLVDMLGGEPNWFAATGTSLVNNIGALGAGVGAAVGLDMNDLKKSQAAKAVKKGFTQARKLIRRGAEAATGATRRSSLSGHNLDDGGGAPGRGSDYECPANALYYGLMRAETAAGKTFIAGATGNAGVKAPAEVEDMIRGALLCFYVTVYGDQQQYIAPEYGRIPGAPLELDKEGFVQKRRAAGDSKDLIAMHREFAHSQMLERRFEASQQAPTDNLRRPTFFNEVSFDILVKVVMQRGAFYTVQAVQAAYEDIRECVDDSGDPDEDTPRLMHFHPLALRVTSSADSKAHDAGVPRFEASRELVNAAYDSHSLEAVMRVLWWRLSDCHGLSWKRGIRALAVLRLLLVCGPEAVLGDCLTHLPELEALCTYRSSIGIGNRIRTLARRCYALVLMRSRLRQRRFGQRRLGRLRRAQPTKIALNVTTFTSLHAHLKEMKYTMRPSQSGPDVSAFDSGVFGAFGKPEGVDDGFSNFNSGVFGGVSDMAAADAGFGTFADDDGFGAMPPAAAAALRGEEHRDEEEDGLVAAAFGGAVVAPKGANPRRPGGMRLPAAPFDAAPAQHHPPSGYDAAAVPGGTSARRPSAVRLPNGSFDVAVAMHPSVAISRSSSAAPRPSGDVGGAPPVHRPSGIVASAAPMDPFFESGHAAAPASAPATASNGQGSAASAFDGFDFDNAFGAALPTSDQPAVAAPSPSFDPFGDHAPTPARAAAAQAPPIPQKPASLQAPAVASAFDAPVQVLQATAPAPAMVPQPQGQQQQFGAFGNPAQGSYSRQGSSAQGSYSRQGSAQGSYSRQGSAQGSYSRQGSADSGFGTPMGGGGAMGMGAMGMGAMGNSAMGGNAMGTMGRQGTGAVRGITGITHGADPFAGLATHQDPRQRRR